jgi:hypothetical protein
VLSNRDDQRRGRCATSFGVYAPRAVAFAVAAPLPDITRQHAKRVRRVPIEVE